jgi:hypothetical protein
MVILEIDPPYLVTLDGGMIPRVKGGGTRLYPGPQQSKGTYK